MKSLSSKINARFFLFITTAFILIQLPVIGDYFRGLNTLIHESGHAVIALLGGHLERITLLWDSEGITSGPQSGRFEAILVSLAGYSFSSFMGFFAFWLLKKSRFYLLIDILLGVLLISLILWVRNLYGVFWILSFSFFFLILVINGQQNVVKSALYLIASILLVDSIKSAYEILAISFLQPVSAGDAENLAYLTMLIPAQFWGIFFFIQAIGFSIYSLYNGLFLIEAKNKAEM